MRLHYLQHVEFEDPASILDWAKDKGFAISNSLLYQGDKLSDISDFEWLVVMGGPMNIYEEDAYPWLKAEKEFIARAIKENKVVIGICLGAQLIADVLGGKVEKSAYKEIGWHPVTFTKEAMGMEIFDNLPDEFVAFHWHGDTFNLPESCERVAKSSGCANQGFIYEERVLGLQFHLECTKEAIEHLIENGRDEIIDDKYIQSEEEMIIQAEEHLGQIRAAMNLILDNILRKYKNLQ